VYKEHVGRTGSCAWTLVHYSGCYAKHRPCMVTGLNGSATHQFKVERFFFAFIVTMLVCLICEIAKCYYLPG
jgi:hypothetical protein